MNKFVRVGEYWINLSTITVVEDVVPEDKSISPKLYITFVNSDVDAGFPFYLEGVERKQFLAYLESEANVYTTY